MRSQHSPERSILSCITCLQQLHVKRGQVIVDVFEPVYSVCPSATANEVIWRRRRVISMHSVYRHKFVRLFVICRHGSSLLWTPALRPYSGPVHLPRERKGIGRCNHNHNNHNNKVQFSALSTAKNRADKALQEYTCINKKIQTLKHELKR